MENEPEQCEPTFCLNGQAYLFEMEAVRAGGPELARMALFETYRHVWYLWSELLGGRLGRQEWEQAHIEMLSGMLLLRDLIPDRGPVLPNGPLTFIH